MKRTRFAIENDRWRLLPVFTGFFILLFCGLPATAKMATDFNPNLDFSKYKTFAYIGGVEQLMRLQLNPELLNNRIHRSSACTADCF